MNTSPPSPPSETEMVAAETAVWEALKTGDGAADRRLLSVDFLGVYPTGFVMRDDHVGELDDGPTVAPVTILETRPMVTGEDSALVAYRVRFRATEGGRVPRRTSCRCGGPGPPSVRR